MAFWMPIVRDCGDAANDLGVLGPSPFSQCSLLMPQYAHTISQTLSLIPFKAEFVVQAGTTQLFTPVLVWFL